MPFPPLDRRALADVPTPSLVVFPERIRGHIDRVIERVGGDPRRVRPHSKTHKTVELTRLQVERGITRHKCATLAEAETLAIAGATDVLVAYPLVGPHLARFVRLRRAYPGVRFAALIDHPDLLDPWSEAARADGTPIDLLVDIDLGMGRTGAALGEPALSLYRRLASAAGLRPAGLHLYDGHLRDPRLEVRRAEQEALMPALQGMIVTIDREGIPCPELVAGGTPTFPLWSARLADEPRLNCSPGTFFLNDATYGGDYPELPFPPAAALLTRVVSRPSEHRLTLDAGSKALAPDPPLERRLYLPDLPDARFIRQNEEHLGVESPHANRYRPGDLLLGLPGHICPTCNLHERLLTVEEGRITGSWEVRARTRRLSFES